MKVLNIIQRYHPAIGGAEFWCRMVSHYLSKNNVDVNIVTLAVDKEEEYWHNKSPRENFKYLGRFDYDDQIKVRRYRRSIPTLGFKFLSKRILDEMFGVYFYGPHSLEMYFNLPHEVKNADIVHLHALPHSHNIIGFFMAKAFKKPIIITPHFHPGHHFYERKMNYFIMSHSDKILAVSEYEKMHFIKEGIPKEKIIVTANGIDPKEYLPANLPNFKGVLFKNYNINADTKIIIFIGRKIEYKGIQVLVNALKLLKVKLDLKLFLIGPSTEWFENFYARLNQQERDYIIDLGEISHQDKVNLLHLSNVLVLPSEYEAFGIVFLEAWICGIPVIGTDRGAMPYVIDGGGLTFKYGDYKELSEKIEFILKDSLLSQKMAREGKDKVMNLYNYDKIGSLVLDTYRKILN
jgi:glycosyltransferase involved in cell wall biosynthesis